MFKSIRGRNVLVTGASKGIGKGIARVFAAQGANVMIAGREQATAAQAADELSGLGGEVRYCAADVSSWDDVQRLIGACVETFGGLDVLCANAGIYPQTKMAEMDVDEWDQVIGTNLKGSFLCVKAAMPALEKSSHGRVVLTSSITGPVTGFPGWTHYGASKSGQLGFLKTAAMELAPLNVTINAVQPGNIITEGLEDLGEDYLGTMAASIPLKRLGTVDDIGNAALFFASDEAAYVTGQTIVVDGGQILPESVEAIEEM